MTICYSLVENKDSNTMLKGLLDNISEARTADIAVAFIKENGLSRILPRLEDAASKGAKIRIITTLPNNAFNEPSALRLLTNLQKRFGSFETRVSRLNHFHQKLYLFQRLGSAEGYLGSSNLTQEGLESEGEINIKIAGLEGQELLGPIQSNFEYHWSLSRRLDDGLLCDYERFYSERQIRPSSKAKSYWKALKRKLGLLGPRPSMKERPEEKGKRRKRVEMFIFSYNALRSGQRYSDVCRALGERFNVTKKYAEYFVWATKRWMTQKPTRSGEKPDWFAYLAREAGIAMKGTQSETTG